MPVTYKICATCQTNPPAIAANKVFFLLIYCCPAQDRGSLLFHLSADRGATADFARGDGDPNFLAGVSVIPDGAAGQGLHCGYRQLLTWKAPGNIYAREGTLSFFWRRARFSLSACVRVLPENAASSGSASSMRLCSR